MNAAIARVRTAETMTTHISSAVNVLRRRLGDLTPHDASTRRPSSGSASVSRKPMQIMTRTNKPTARRAKSRDGGVISITMQVMQTEMTAKRLASSK